MQVSLAAVAIRSQVKPCRGRPAQLLLEMPPVSELGKCCVVIRISTQTVEFEAIKPVGEFRWKLDTSAVGNMSTKR